MRSFTGIALAGILSVPSAAEGGPVTVFLLEGLDGRREVIEPAKLAKPLLVYLFSTQEPGWKKELLQVRKLWKELKGKPFALVSVASEAPGGEEALRDFVVRESIAFPVGMDRGMKIFLLLGGNEVPRLVLFGADGSESWRETRPPSKVRAELRRRVVSLIGPARSEEGGKP